MSEEQSDWFAWNEKWQSATTKLAYEESRNLLASQADWLKAIETKVTTLFTLASVIITVTPTIQRTHPVGLTAVVWASAVIAYLLAVVQCVRAYDIKSYKSDPDPLHMLIAEHLTLTEDQFRITRLREIAVAYKHNRDIMTGLASHLRWALGFSGAEVVLVAIALLLTS